MDRSWPFHKLGRNSGSCSGRNQEYYKCESVDISKFLRHSRPILYTVAAPTAQLVVFCGDPSKSSLQMQVKHTRLRDSAK